MTDATTLSLNDLLTRRLDGFTYIEWAQGMRMDGMTSIPTIARRLAERSGHTIDPATLEQAFQIDTRWSAEERQIARSESR